MSKKIPSKYQKAIFEFVKNGQGNCVINAVAGSGKTTTIVASLKFIPFDKSVIFLAFNKSITEEIKQRVTSNITVKTFHSVGASSIYRTYRDKSILNNNKIYEIINSIAPRWQLKDGKNIKIDKDYKGRVKKIVDLARLTLSETEEELIELCHKHQIDYLNKEVERAIKILEIANNDISSHDFNDMVYWAANYDHFKLDKYDYIFVDECQDLNKAQHKIIEKLSHQTTRRISVGDRNQTIYGFAGADTESFDKLVNSENTITLPLSVNYRCGSDIVNLAKGFVKEIEAFENNGKGRFNSNASVKEVEEGDMILCRMSVPLVKLCIELLQEGKKAYVKGADIGEDLVRLIIRSNTKSTDDLKSWLDYEMKKVIANIQKLYPTMDIPQIKRHNSYVIFKEKYDLLYTIINDEKISNNDKLISKIRQIFLDNSNGICLSTIHKSKGLENDRVFILDKEKTLPSKYATLPWQVEQEKNLEYVAITRAKEYLGFITDWTFFTKKEYSK